MTFQNYLSENIVNNKKKKIMKYIHLFRSQEEKNTYLNTQYEEPFVCKKIEQGVEPQPKQITYNLKEQGMYLTFEIISGGTLYWRYGSASYPISRTIEYRKNEGE